MRHHAIAFGLIATLTACAGPAQVPGLDDTAATEPVQTTETAATISQELESTPETTRAELEAQLAECKGQPYLEMIGQPEAALTGLLPDDARVIPKDGIVTQDYRPQRVNIDLDENRAIARVWCG